MTHTHLVTVQARTLPFRMLTDRSWRAVRHLILVVALLLISVSQSMSFYGGSPVPDQGIYRLSLVMAVCYLTVAYLHIYVLVPRFLAEKNYAAYLLFSVGLVLALSGARFLQHHLVQNIWNFHIQPAGWMARLDSLSDFALNLLCFTGVSLTVLLKYWLREQRKITELETQRLAVEVESYKHSIDPDMLLGAIHQCGLDCCRHPERSAAMILQLSQLLRYQLYESRKDRVFLRAEIDFIRNYLAFEKQRNGDLAYDFSVEGQTMMYIVPFVFMPVIKTALANRKPGQVLKIRLGVHQDRITFRCNCLDTVDMPGIGQALKRLSVAYGQAMEYHRGDPGQIDITLCHA